MNNNSTLIGQLKRDLLNFSEKISAGLNRPTMKFIANMLYGLIVSQSIMLTDIGRALNEDISLKKTEDRLSRNLKPLCQDIGSIQNRYIEEVKPSVDDRTIFCIDPSDICKKYGRCQEGLDWIRDASEKKSAWGWNYYEVTALTHSNKLPIPVYSQVVAADAPRSVTYTHTDEILEAIRSTQRHFGAIGITTIDRGGDANPIFKHCIDSEQKFIIRNKVNRNLIVGDESINIATIADGMKGKFRLDHKDKYGKHHTLKTSFKSVRLPCRPDEDLTLIIVYGFGKEPPMLLLTNMTVLGKETCLRIVKIYLCRWRIDEYFRFIKDQFHLENIRVLSMESICALVFLLSVLSGWIAMFANKKGESLLLAAVLVRAKRLYAIPNFTLYAVADGIYDILKHAVKGIRPALSKPPQSQQLSLFEPSNFNLPAV